MYFDSCIHFTWPLRKTAIKQATRRPTDLRPVRGTTQAIKAIVYSIGEFEWISINLSKSREFSLQTSENNLKPT